MIKHIKNCSCDDCCLKDLDGFIEQTQIRAKQSQLEQPAVISAVCTHCKRVEEFADAPIFRELLSAPGRTMCGCTRGWLVLPS